MTSGLGARGWGLARQALATAGAGGSGLAVTRGEIVRRPTVTGCKSACDRRAQSSSGTSMAATSEFRSERGLRRRRARRAVEKNTRIESVAFFDARSERNRRSQRQDGSASSPAVLSSAGYESSALSEHVLDAIEQVALVLLLFARARLELLLRQRPSRAVRAAVAVPRELLRRLHLHGREQVAASAAR